MRPHERLDVWKKSNDFVGALYEATEKFPKEEKFGLTSQLRRAAVSISANIAEGAARKTAKEFGYFLSNSQGSASEVETEDCLQASILDRRYFRRVGVGSR